MRHERLMYGRIARVEDCRVDLFCPIFSESPCCSFTAILWMDGRAGCAMHTTSGRAGLSKALVHGTWLLSFYGIKPHLVAPGRRNSSSRTLMEFYDDAEVDYTVGSVDLRSTVVFRRRVLSRFSI